MPLPGSPISPMESTAAAAINFDHPFSFGEPSELLELKFNSIEAMIPKTVLAAREPSYQLKQIMKLQKAQSGILSNFIDEPPEEDEEEEEEELQHKPAAKKDKND